MSKNLDKILDEELVNMMDHCSKIVKDEISKISFRDLSSGKKIMSILLKQKAAEKIRNKNEKIGIRYASVILVKSDWRNGKISSGKWNDILNESSNLGISVMAFTDENVILNEELINKLGTFPEIIFPVFIKDSLLNNKCIDYFYQHRNIIPVICYHGNDINFEMLKKLNILYVLKVNADSSNYEKIINNKFVNDIYNRGCKAFVYIEDLNSLSDDKRKLISNSMEYFKGKYKGIFVNFPGNEKIYKGCLEEGIGFAYIDEYGKVNGKGEIERMGLRNMEVLDIVKAREIVY